MEINTRDFGPVTVEEDAVFDFPQGIYGFEDDISFAIFQKKFEDVSFLYLQSVINTVPCFLVFEPVELMVGYDPQMSDEDLNLCQVTSPEDLIFLVIANVTDKVEEMSVNMKSPIVLNPKNRTGRQVILQNPDYTIRYQPFINKGSED